MIGVQSSLVGQRPGQDDRHLGIVRPSEKISLSEAQQPPQSLTDGTALMTRSEGIPQRESEQTAGESVFQSGQVSVHGCPD
jgi:hypothetical protein